MDRPMCLALLLVALCPEARASSAEKMKLGEMMIAYTVVGEYRSERITMSAGLDRVSLAAKLDETSHNFVIKKGEIIWNKAEPIKFVESTKLLDINLTTEGVTVRADDSPVLSDRTKLSPPGPPKALTPTPPSPGLPSPRKLPRRLSEGERHDLYLDLASYRTDLEGYTPWEIRGTVRERASELIAGALEADAADPAVVAEVGRLTDAAMAFSPPDRRYAPIADARTFQAAAPVLYYPPAPRQRCGCGLLHLFGHCRGR